VSQTDTRTGITKGIWAHYEFLKQRLFSCSVGEDKLVGPLQVEALQVFRSNFWNFWI